MYYIELTERWEILPLRLCLALKNPLRMTGVLPKVNLLGKHMSLSLSLTHKNAHLYARKHSHTNRQHPRTLTQVM